MRDPVARQRPVINLDEFERRLRQPAPQAPANEDPLAELARLVGDDKDPYQQMFQEHAEQMPERAPDKFQRNFKSNVDPARQPAPPPRALRPEPQVRYPARDAPRPAGAAAASKRRLGSTGHASRARQTPAAGSGSSPQDRARARRASAAKADDAAGSVDCANSAPSSRPKRPSARSIRRPKIPLLKRANRSSGPAPQAPSSRDLGGNFAAIEAGLRGSLEPNFRPAPAQTRPSEYRPQQNYQIPTPRREPVDYRAEPDYRAQADYRTQADYQADYRQQQPQWDDEDEADYRDADYRQQYQPEPADDEDDDWLDMHQQAPVARPMPSSRAVPVTMREPVRSRRLVYMTAAVVLVGMGGIGVVFASKHNMASPHQIAMIKASTNPAKVQAPNDGTNTAMQDDSVFDKTPQPPPAGVANHEEQPVDLAQTNGNAQQGSDNGNASTIPVPTPPSEMPPWQQDAALDQLHQQQANAQAQQQPQPQQQATPNPGNGANPGTQVADSTNQAFALGGTIQSKKVKTLAVRPDGSVMPDNANNNDSAVNPNSMQMPAIAQGDGAAPAPQGDSNDGANSKAQRGPRPTIRMSPISSRAMAQMTPMMPTTVRPRSGRIM